MQFQEYFSAANVLDCLCRIRVTEADNRHTLHFYRNISSKARNPSMVPSALNECFPPRRKWFRPPLNDRRDKSRYDLNRLALKKAIHYGEKYGTVKGQDWYEKLQELIYKIRALALQDATYSVESPKILPFLKNREKHEYRLIAIYNLCDRVILGLTARYLREVFDPDFLPCSYAFRVKNSNTRSMPTHHLAVQHVYEHRKKFQHHDLFVAECDIQKFFDTVHHQVAISALDKAIARANERGIILDKRALQIFSSSLSSYTFHGIAREQGEAWLKDHDKKGRIKWPEKDLKTFYVNPRSEPLGVPQGGALSPVIANLILHAVDKETIGLDIQPDPDLFYARFCDDMILMHPRKSSCEAALDRYCEGLRKQKLCPHAPKEIGMYSKCYYDMKSKAPFLWGKPAGKPNAAPWISFLGYQIRYDLAIRIRKISVEKELRKQRKVADTVIKVLDSDGQVSCRTKDQILFRVENRLISMSVGRIKLGKKYVDRSSFCWTSGFYALKGKQIVATQLKRLDRSRERQLSIIRRRLEKHEVEQVRPTRSIDAPDYYGAPFSYFGQFLKRSSTTDSASSSRSDSAK